MDDLHRRRSGLSSPQAKTGLEWTAFVRGMDVSHLRRLSFWGRDRSGAFEQTRVACKVGSRRRNEQSLLVYRWRWSVSYFRWAHSSKDTRIEMKAWMEFVDSR